MVTRTSLNITLCVHCLSCYLSISSVVVLFFVIPLRTQTAPVLSGGMLREMLFPSWWWWSLIRYTTCVEFLNIFISWFQTFAVFWILSVFFWVFPRRPIVVWRRFGTLYQFHLQELDVKYEVEGSETSANHNRTPGKYPKEYIQDIFISMTICKLEILYLLSVLVSKRFFLKFQYLSATSVSNSCTHWLYSYVPSASISEYNYPLFLGMAAFFTSRANLMSVTTKRQSKSCWMHISWFKLRTNIFLMQQLSCWNWSDFSDPKRTSHINLLGRWFSEVRRSPTQTGRFLSQKDAAAVNVSQGRDTRRSAQGRDIRLSA